jgi:hypothetical protein
MSHVIRQENGRTDATGSIEPLQIVMKGTPANLAETTLSKSHIAAMRGGFATARAGIALAY